MSDVYRVIHPDEGRHGVDFDEYYDLLVGPDGFECLLTEREDRIWSRDGKAVVERLNQQHEQIARLREDLARFADWVLDRIEDGAHGCLTGDCPHWIQSECCHNLVKAFREETQPGAGLR